MTPTFISMAVMPASRIYKCKAVVEANASMFIDDNDHEAALSLSSSVRDVGINMAAVEKLATLTATAAFTVWVHTTFATDVLPVNECGTCQIRCHQPSKIIFE